MAETSCALADLIERWRSVPTTIAADVDDGACLLDPAIRPLRGSRIPVRLFGRAVTAKCAPPDFTPVINALVLLQPGDVLVISAGGDAKTAMIGDILGGYARSRGCAGILCDGAVRDTGDLARWDDFAVFCRSVVPRGPRIEHLGEVNVPVEIAGRVVHPGDIVIADDDGAVTLRPERAAALIADAEKKMALELTWREKLAAGVSPAELFGTAGKRAATR